MYDYRFRRLTAELAELDKDFARTNLSPLEIGDLYRRRKDIYETLYPETKAGTSQAIGMNKVKGNNLDCNLQSRRKSFIAGAFARMSKENLRDVLKMLDAVNSSIQALGDVAADGGSNSLPRVLPARVLCGRQNTILSVTMQKA